MAKRKVPTGVAILAVLNFLSGLLLVILGAMAYRLQLVFDVGSFAVVAVAIGLLTLVAGYGLWVGKSWAWYLGILLGAVTVIYSVWNQMPVPLIVDAVIIAYLLRKGIQKYFKVNIGWAW
jgi:uncharacterized membrane protein (DUF2068 family)